MMLPKTAVPSSCAVSAGTFQHLAGRHLWKIPGVGGMVVSCTIETEERGVKSTREFRPAVRPVYSQPDRWTIHGGI